MCKVVMSCDQISFSAADLGTLLLSQEDIPGICLQPPSSPSPHPPVPAERPDNWGELECGAHDNTAVAMVTTIHTWLPWISLSTSPV